MMTAEGGKTSQTRISASQKRHMYIEEIDMPQTEAVPLSHIITQVEMGQVLATAHVAGQGLRSAAA